MLYLNPPLYIINRVSVFRDHEDPLQWYYLPGPPRVTRALDAASGSMVPQLRIIKFHGSAGTGGFLNFDVDLGVDSDVLEELQAEIKGAEDLSELPRLAPVPLIDGTVKMMLFDRQTGDTPPDDGQPALQFALRLTHNAKPSLYGDNRAAFSVQLSQEGITTLEEAIQGELSPIGIVYALDYLALRPAYSVRLNVDWERVQEHMDKTFGTDSIFFQSQITEAVDKLIDERVIDLQVDTFIPEGEEDSAVLGRRDDAVAEVQDMITNAFFEPSLNPEKDEADAWDKFEHLVKTGAAMAATGGWGSIISFSYKKVHYTRIDKKTMNVNINERTTVKKTIYPQGHLSGLFKVLREPGVDLDRFVIPVTLDDPWFTRRKVQTIARTDFEEDGISSLNVQLQYAGVPKNTILEPDKPTDELEWNSIVENNTMQWEVTARYTVNFKGVDGTERPLALESPEEIITVDNLEINPRELYTIVNVPILALNFPWERYSHLEVQTEYSDPENGIRSAEDFLLDVGHPGATWKMFVRDPDRTQFRYKVIYRAVDHKDVEMTWIESDEALLVFRDPFPTKRTLEIVPIFNWEKVDRAFVDVAYEDEANGVFEEASFEFNSDTTATQKFTASLEDPGRRLISYRVTVIEKDGNLVEIPPSFTLDRRITVREDMKGHRIIAIQPQAVDFAGKRVEELTVEARYEDPNNGLSFADLFTFKSPEDQAHFEFDYVDEARSGFAYRVMMRFTNNMTRENDWQETSKDEVILPVG